MPTPRIKKRRRIAKIKALAEHVGIVFSGTVFVLAGIVFVARLDEVTIQKVSVEGERAIDPSEVVQLTGEVLSGSYVFLPKRNILIYPEKALKSYLEYHLPRIESVEIKRKDLNSLRISIVERELVALWCGEEPGGTDFCYFVDEEGFVYSPSPFSSGDVLFRYYGGDVNPRSPLRSHFAQPDWLYELKEFTYYLEELNLTAKGIHLKEDDFEVLLMNDSRLHLTRDGSMEEAFTRLRSLFRGSEHSFIVDGDPTFDYIDLRFGNRVFYKKKNDE